MLNYANGLCIKILPIFYIANDNPNPEGLSMPQCKNCAVRRDLLSLPIHVTFAYVGFDKWFCDTANHIAGCITEIPTPGAQKWRYFPGHSSPLPLQTFKNWFSKVTFCCILRAIVRQCNLKFQSSKFYWLVV